MMRVAAVPCALLVLIAAAIPATGQRITTIQLDGVQYFVSRMNPYSPELNYFLAYQYCRSLGLQLASFETKEKADSITTYLTNAGYNKYDFWTSGNNLGTDMFLWMSTGLPFNATFNYMKRPGEINVEHPALVPHPQSMDPLDVPQGSTAPQRTARHGSTEHVLSDGCVALKAPTFHWEPQHCGEIKDFICEQTRCYYYNYGSIPVSSAQGKPLSLTTTTAAPPLTSSPPAPQRNEHLPTHFTLNDLLKLRPSSLDGIQSPHLKSASVLAHKSLPQGLQVDGQYSGIKHHDRVKSEESHISLEKESAAHGTYDGDTDVNDTPTPLPSEPDNGVDEEGAATIGPYNHSADLQMGDDPSAYAAATNNNQDDYISTIEPDTVTTYKSETLQRIAGKVLAAPSV